MVGANARETLLVAKVANKAGKGTRKGDRHKDVEARRAYMRAYMRKRRAARFRIDATTAAKPSPQLAPDQHPPVTAPKLINPAMGPLHADFVAEHSKTGGFLKPALDASDLSQLWLAWRSARLRLAPP